MKQQLVVTVAVGLVSGLAGAMLALAFRPAATPATALDLASDAAPRQPTAPLEPASTRTAATSKTLDNGDGEQDVAAMLARMIVLLEGIAEQVKASSVGGEQRQNRGAADPSGARHEPGWRPPGALVPWLPPEGVPLVKAWYSTQYRTEIRDVEDSLANWQSILAAFSPSAVESNLKRWKRKVSNYRQRLSEVERIGTELDLARWLEEHGAKAPRPWQLAEFARKRATGSDR